jgi:hypothetical protein
MLLNYRYVQCILPIAVTLVMASGSPAQTVFSASTGDEFRAALAAANRGDTIVLQAAATFAGPFFLPLKIEGSGWITIVSSAIENLPPPGMRIDPKVHSPHMPKLVPGPGTDPIIATIQGASHYRFIGLEITTGEPGAGDKFLDHLVRLGSEVDQETERSIADLPHHFIFERCFIHGSPTRGSRRGIAMNAGNGVVVRFATTAEDGTETRAWPNNIDWTQTDGGVQVLDSYFSDFKHASYDTQAVACWNGAGPFRIENNYLEAAGENVMFGGWDPSIPGLVPADIEVRRNHFYKPLSWNQWDPAYTGTDWAVKNLFELKNARRVLVEGNVMENNWVDSQNGFAILFTPRNQNGNSPWSVVEDVKFINNHVRHVSSGINLLGRDDTPGRPSEQTRRILIENNLFEDLDHSRWGGSTTPVAGRFLQMLKGAADVTINHNTVFQSRAVIFSAGAAHTGFVFANNIARHNDCLRNFNCGIFGDGTSPGRSTLARYFYGAIPHGNVMFKGNDNGRWRYEGNNFFPASVDFQDSATGDYRLKQNKNNGYFLGAGTDGKDPGVDLEALYLATGGVIPTAPR